MLKGNEERSSVAPTLQTTVSKVNIWLRNKTKGSEVGRGIQNETRIPIGLNEDDEDNEDDDIQSVVPWLSKEAGGPRFSQHIRYIKSHH